MGHLGSHGSKVHFHYNCFSSYNIHCIVTWLMVINKLETLYKTYWLKFRFGVIWGHRGQKVIFTKNANPPTYYVAWSCDLCTWYTWRPTTKVTVLNFNQRSIGVTGIKKVISTKNDITSPCCIAWLQDSYMCISWRPSTYVAGQGSTRCPSKSEG